MLSRCLLITSTSLWYLVAVLEAMSLLASIWLMLSSMKSQIRGASSFLCFSSRSPMTASRSSCSRMRRFSLWAARWFVERKFLDTYLRTSRSYWSRPQ
jgi:hypothetical protein